MAEEKIVRWKVIDPRGIKIVMYDEKFVDHVVGDHGEKDAKIRQSVEGNAKRTLQDPHFIMRDPSFQSRFQYLRLDLIGVEGRMKKIKPIKVVIEQDEDSDGWKVVTWGAQNRLQGQFTKEDIVYEK